MLKTLPLSIVGLLLICKLSAQPAGTVTNSYKEGVTLRNAQKYPQALIAFKEAIEKDPNNADALYDAGWVSNELKEYDNAVTFLQKAKQIKSSPTIFFELAFAYDNAGRKDEAKENYKKSLELYPKYYDADKCLAEIFYDEGNYETALNYYKKYFEGNKSPDPHYYYKAAWCSNYLKDYADALLYLEKYQPESQKDFAKKYTEIGNTYLMLGYNDDAITAYQTSLDGNPNNGAALRGMADVYYNNLQDYSKALQYYNLALQNDEENSRNCYYKAGWIYVEQKKYDEAITALQKAADYDPKDPNTREQLGYSYYMQNKYDTAISWFNQAIELNAQSKVSYYYKGFCYATLNQKENAMEAYSKLKPLNKDAAEDLLKEIKEKEKYFKNLAKASKKQEKQ